MAVTRGWLKTKGALKLERPSMLPSHSRRLWVEAIEHAQTYSLGYP